MISCATNLCFSLVLQGNDSVFFIVLHLLNLEATCPGDAAINSFIMSETLQLIIIVSQITLNPFELFSPI